ncbi:MAG: cold shock domain-containing protein [Anaerolineae bacterium]
MPYQDSWAVCTKCGQQFVFRVEDQRRQAERGEEITPPEFCPSCRAPSRAERPSEPRREPRQQPETWQKPPRATLAALGPGPHEGQVKWYDREKGYGFIAHLSGEELFFHRTGIAPGETPDFVDGTPVTYCIEETEKGPQAVDVERMDV